MADTRLLQAKTAAAVAGAARIKARSRVALGTGSTAELAIRALKEQFPDGGELVTVASSRATEVLARSLGFHVEPLAAGMEFDSMLDGADEVSPSLALTKGGGGALFREKFLARRSRDVIILVDPSKLVKHLGELHQIPIEVVPFARPTLAFDLAKEGYSVTHRLVRGNGMPFVTDNGNEILDLAPARPIEDPAAVEGRLRALPGVVECGIFVGLAHRVLVGLPDGSVQELRP